MRISKCLATLTAAVALLAAPPVHAQTGDEFFAGDRVDDLWIHINTRDWQTLRARFQDNTFYPCDLQWRTVRVYNAGCRSRGHGSRSGIKPGVELHFDHYVSGQRFLGLSQLVLDNMWQDPSMIQERLTMWLFRRTGVAAPRESHVRLYVGAAREFAGVYAAVEPVDSTFLERVFGERDAYLYEYRWQDVYNFEDLGNELEPYALRFEPRSHVVASMFALYSPIRELVATINEAPVERIAESLDLRSLAAQLAVENYVSDWDGLLGYAGLNNFYLSHTPGAPFKVIPWDKDVEFIDVGLRPSHNVEFNVLARKLWADPAASQRYLAVLLGLATIGGEIQYELEREFAQSNPQHSLTGSSQSRTTSSRQLSTSCASFSASVRRLSGRMSASSRPRRQPGSVPMRAVYACLGVLLTAALAAAQTLAGVSGTVRDESGTPLEGVAIDIVSVSTAVTRQTVTDADGRFVVTGLRPADDYRVSATGSGLRSFVRGQMLLRAGEPVTLDILLGVGVTERLDVAASQPDASAASPSQQIDEGLTRDVPLIDRGFLHLSSLGPGFTGRPDYPDAQGQRYWTHNIVVDGASDFSKWRGAPRSFYSGYGRESIREVTILPELFAATIGGALASVTMATTRAGGTSWSGSTFLFVRHSALAAPPVFAIEKPVGSTAQYGGAIGGPLRPATFFFGSYDGRRSRDHNIVSSAVARGVAVPTDQDERIAFARVDHRVSNTQSITARFNAQFFKWHDEPGALTLPGTGTAYTNNAYTALLTQATQLSPLSLNDLRVEVSRYVDLRTDLRPVAFVSRSGYSIEGGLLGPAGLGVDPEHTFEVHDTLLRATGSHSLRLGATASVVHAHATGSRYQRGAYFFAGAPAVAPQPYLYIQSVPAGPDSATVDSRSTVFGAFLQDDWRAAANLTVSAGVRYDVEQVHDVENFSAPLDANNVQPRLGVVWRPRESSTVLRAAFGLYTQQHVLDPIDQVQLQGIGGVATIVIPADAAGFPRFPDVQAADVALRAAPHDIYRAATEFRNAYSLQAGAGVERAIRRLTISADYLHLNGYDLVSVIDVNAPASLVKPAQRTVAEADATRPLTPDAGYRKLLTIGNLGRSWYRALQVRASGGTPSLRTVAAYTFAHADDQGNYELPEDSRNLSVERGRAAMDIRHNLTGAVTWQLPGSGRLTRGWTVATIGVARSGRPYTVTWGDDRNGTTQNDARPGGRNTGQTGPYRVMDLSLSKRATVRRAAIETRLEVFNVFSTVNYDEYVRALLSPMYGQPISAFPRRRAQLAVVVRF